MPESPVILVTGASSGIGEATARLFAREGYRVALAARRRERLEKISLEIRRDGGLALPVATDLSDLEDIQRLVQATLGEFGQIDVLLNNAGFGCLDWLENLDPISEIEQQLRVNLLAVVQLTQAVLPHMIQRRSGHIINMGSVAGLLATPTYTVYAAGKFALRGFGEALRREVSVYGVHVSALYPGGVKTEFGEKAKVRRKTGVTTPGLLRLSSEDVARAVMSLVRRPRRGLIIPWPMYFGVWANTFFPGLVDRVIESNFVRKERGL